MGEAAFIDGDAGHLEPVLKLGAQLAGDLFMVAAQGDLLVFEIIIGVAGTDGAHGDLDLSGDEFHVIVDVEARLGGVGDAPDELGCDLDGIAALVVDLDLFADEIVSAAGDFGDADPGPCPAQAGATVGALIIAEQGEHAGFIGRVFVEADEQEDDGKDQADG